MNYDKLIEDLRDKFGPEVREMCADDKFGCDELCAGNILTAKCIVWQAADAIEQLQAENADLRRQFAEKAELLGEAVKYIPHTCDYCYYQQTCKYSETGKSELCREWQWSGTEEIHE